MAGRSTAAVPTDPGEFARRIRDGDVGAFEAAFRAYYGPLCGFVGDRLGSVAEAEEVVQEVFLRVWSGRSRLDPEGSLRAYLYRSALNASLNVLKRRRVESGWLRAAAAADRAVVGPETGDPAQARELSAAIERTLAELPDRCRLVFTLSRQQGLTYPEIARALDISIKTVETQMGRALKALRSGLAAHLS